MGKCMSISMHKISDKIGQVEQELNSRYKPVAKAPEAPLPAVAITFDDEDEDLDTIFAESEI